MSDDLPKPGDSTPSPQQPYQTPNYPNHPQTSPSYPPELPQNPDPIIEAHRETAEHQPRDPHGRFIPEHPDQTSPNPPNTPNHPNIPLPISFTQNTKYSEKNDPPLVSVSVTNPITYLKLFIKRLLKNEGITIKIKPLTAIAMILALSTAFGTGFNVATFFFPNSSPIFKRQVSYQGTIQKNQIGGYFLILPDSSLWKLKPKFTNINLEEMVGKQAIIQGNLTREPNLIEVSQVIPLSPLITQPIQVPPIPATNSGQPNP